jgi:uncharacterized protein involved in exopolysaccharide biosynthesis
MSDAAPAPLLNPREIAAILWRRRWWAIAPAAIGFVLALAVVLMREPLYQSQAKLLITSQQIPTTLVPAATGNYADERIARIRQQILSREALTRLIADLKLYPKERARLHPDEVLEIMRGAIGVDLVGTNAEGQPGQGSTIAFDLSFRYFDPAIARAVAERLTAMFLRADKRDRTEQATGTAAFLGRRAAELRDQLLDITDKRRAIEARYAGALPEQVAMSTQSGASLRAEVSRIDAETQGLMQQNSLLAARAQEIAASPGPAGEGLRRAQEKLNQLSAVYSDAHPDVVAARDEVAREQALVAAARPSGAGGAITAEIVAARARIGALAARRAGLLGQIGGLERVTSLAPQATYELNNVERDYDNLRLQYQDIREKQMEAQVAANLQTEDKGERFTVVDAPSLAIAPLGTGAMQTLLAGMLSGFGAGLALILVREFMAGTIHGEAALARVMGTPPIVCVPTLRPGSQPGIAVRLNGMMRTRIDPRRRSGARP